MFCFVQQKRQAAFFASGVTGMHEMGATRAVQIALVYARGLFRFFELAFFDQLEDFLMEGPQAGTLLAVLLVAPFDAPDIFL